MNELEIDSQKRWPLLCEKDEIISELKKSRFTIYQIQRSFIILRMDSCDLAPLQKMIVSGVKLEFFDNKVTVNLLLKKDITIILLFCHLVLCFLVVSESWNLKTVVIFLFLSSITNWLMLFSVKSIFLKELKRAKIL